MSITKLPRPRTTTGRGVQHAIRRLTPRSAVGRLGVALSAEVGGALGDKAHQAFQVMGRSWWPTGEDTTEGTGDTQGAPSGNADRDEETRRETREQRRQRYTEQARRMQEEARRRAQEAYRQAQAGWAASGSKTQPGGGDSRSGRRTYRYRGRAVPDYYEVLEVSTKARQSVIDRAYRALMREDHPDLGGDPRKAQLINEAYEVLRDPERRRAYDKENGLL